MRTFLISFLLICTSFYLHAQKDWSKIDQSSASVPSRLTSYQDIAKHLTRNTKDETEKVRALYYWITHAISYDMKLARNPQVYSSSDELVLSVLKKRKGVCQHYAELFLAMCKTVGVKAYLVKGYTRYADGSLADESHSWNAVEIHNEFYLLDLTWAAGYQAKRKYVHKFRDDYFMIRPEVFVKTHMPFDPIWQFLPNPLNHTEFMNQNFAKLNAKGTYPFRQLISEYEKLGKFDQYKVANERINASGVKNKLIKNMLDENLTQLNLILYNKAVEKLNEGVNQYNTYIGHKNKQFKNPDLSDEEIQKLLQSAEQNILRADEITQNIYTNHPELSKAVRKLRKQLPKLNQTLKVERSFLNTYLSKSAIMRKAMFIR